MLVLSRRPDEKILLPTVPVLVKVISANAGLVRLGFDAPADVPILREELTHGDARPPEEPAEAADASASASAASPWRWRCSASS